MHADQCRELADSLELLCDSYDGPEVSSWLRHGRLTSAPTSTPLDLLRRGQVHLFAREVEQAVTLR